MNEPTICAKCSAKPCRTAKERLVSVCSWGVSYFREGENILKAETPIPLRYLSQNLRHELSRVIAILFRDANEIDPYLRSNEIQLDNPASRIIGAANILDNFVEMIAGVHSFQPLRDITGDDTDSPDINSLLNKYFNTYSLINNPRRNRTLTLSLKNTDNQKIARASKAVEYMIAAIMDNAWKYSIDNSEILVELVKKDNELSDVYFCNYAPRIPEELNIFDIGSQADASSEGFGLGLHWVKVLTDYYNDPSLDMANPLNVRHYQKQDSDDIWIQTFQIENLRISSPS